MLDSKINSFSNDNKKIFLYFILYSINIVDQFKLIDNYLINASLRIKIVVIIIIYLYNIIIV